MRKLDAHSGREEDPRALRSAEGAAPKEGQRVRGRAAVSKRVTDYLNKMKFKIEPPT